MSMYVNIIFILMLILFFIIHSLFPSLTHILYLDVDTIVLHNISWLWKEIIASDKLVTAIPRYIFTIEVTILSL